MSSSNHNTFISIANNNTINYRDVNGNFTKKSKKGLKYKGNINKMTRQKNGFGVVKWEDGSHFSISFNNNHAEGPGKFYNATNKSIYNGYYENNIPKGYGCYESLQYQVTFEGEWCKKELSGIGIEIWNDETYYQALLWHPSFLYLNNNYSNQVFQTIHLLCHHLYFQLLFLHTVPQVKLSFHIYLLHPSC